MPWLLQLVGAGFLALGLLATSAGGAEELVAAIRDDLIQELVDLVVAEHPVLQSQREIVDQLERLKVPEGFAELKLTLTGDAALKTNEDTQETYFAPSAGLGLEVPLIDPGRHRDLVSEKVALVERREKARQTYLNLKHTVISDLLNRVDRIVQLQRERAQVLQLGATVQEQLTAAQKQVAAGLMEQQQIWSLRERLLELNVRGDKLLSQLATTRRSTALTLGGSEWAQLQQLLEQVSLDTLR